MTEVTVFLASLISMVFIVILLLWLYQDYRSDVFRQKMFNLRDDLFDEARHGKIDFDEEAYGMLRSAINGFIRFGHKVNLAQVLLLNVMLKKEGKLNRPFAERLHKNMEHCTAEQRKIIMSYYIRMNFYIIEHLLLSSIALLVTLVIPVVFLLEAKKHIEKVVNYFAVPLDNLDTAAFTTGKNKRVSAN